MRFIGLCFIVLLVAGRSRPVDTAKVASGAVVELQKSLSQEYGAQRFTVGKVAVVETASRKYDGTAAISEKGISFPLPVAITSDGSTTLVQWDHDKLEQAASRAIAAYLAGMKDRYSDEILKDTYARFLPASLEMRKAEFRERLQTVIPIKFADGFYFGSGCKAHECGSEEAAWAIKASDGSVAIIVMEQFPGPGTPAAREIKGTRPEFFVSGASKTDIPPPLRDWAEGNGMTDMNVGFLDPAANLPR